MVVILSPDQANGSAVKKLRVHTANFITVANAGPGTASLLICAQGQLHLGALFIFAAALFDRFDGKIARRLKIESAFGKQLDSLCDIISFGAAPVLLMYQGLFHLYGFAGIAFSLIYIACGVIRLARFNLSANRNYFTGLPITAAGVITAFSFLGIPHIPPYWILILFLTVSLLMVSPFKLKKT
jgi:CDP-diacylglycerol--serine O-phosphatidyltransferase